MISPDILFTLGSAFGIGLVLLVVHVWREHSPSVDPDSRTPAE